MLSLQPGRRPKETQANSSLRQHEEEVSVRLQETSAASRGVCTRRSLRTPSAKLPQGRPDTTQQARGAGLVADTCEERRDERVVALQQASFEESRDQAAWVGVPYMFNTLRDTE